MSILNSIRKALTKARKTVNPTTDTTGGEPPVVEVQVSYVLNRGNRRLHKLVGGRSFESCNVDDIPLAFRGEYDDLVHLRDDLRAGRIKPCRRCFPNGLEG